MNKALIVFLLTALLMGACAPALPTEENDAGEEPAAAATVEEQQPTTSTEVRPVNADLQMAQVERIPALQLSDSVTAKQVAENNQFAFELYQQLKQAPELSDGDIFFSPYSISSALAMAYGGAQKETETQMQETLHYVEQPAAHEAFNTLDQYFNTLNQSSSENESDYFQLMVSNALWSEQRYPLQPNYLDLLAEYYGAGMYTLDFIGNPEGSRQAINDWVAEQTNQKIIDLLGPNSITTNTRVVLTNTIYFIASWIHTFEEEQTADTNFTLLSGEVVQVPMMNNTERYNYAQGSSWQMIELPYTGYSASMVILLPNEGKFADVEASLTAESFKQIYTGAQFLEADLYLPKFHTESSFGLNDILGAMGMSDAFDPTRADFSGITGKPDLFISSVLHKAVIDLDENGTEAAAATAVVVGITSAMPDESKPIEFRIDRPFIYAIINPESGSILFLGRMLNPLD
jgi:serpin B